MPLKKLVVLSATTAVVGLVAVIVLQVFSGLDYRAQEMQGLDPGDAPGWTVVGTDVGLVVLAVGVVALAVTGVVALVRNRAGDPDRAPGVEG